ncbi:MAG TPA: glycosyl hydrolase family 79 C-terminal domain-containing protein [Solirubrobacteraceae bacterium]|nr:glycosyl hydrolase family 79 C-terminal domain-containing protein [Solirubrobacteraceae bacterium]
MVSRRTLWRLTGAAAALLLTAAVLAIVLSTGGSTAGSAEAADTSTGPAAVSPGSGSGLGSAGAGAAAVVAAARTPAPSLTLSPATGAGGRPIAPGYLGFSLEFQAVRAYTGSDPRRINPVLVQLIRNLTPGQAPVLRIGGDSSDVSYAPARGVHPPAWVSYRLTPSWMATTAALAHALGAHMIMGLNLAANQPALAAAEARDYLKALGRGSLDALEIGNEPNVYSKIAVYHTVFGIPVTARPSNYPYSTFRRQYEAVVRALPRTTLAGPALATGPTPGPGSWAGSMPGFLRRLPRLTTMTVHRYPLRNCNVGPANPQYPSIPHLLSEYATGGLAASLRPWIRIAHSRHRLLRVDELNSVACRGMPGVSDTFASALWVTDALFSLVHAGVDGIDMHTLPNAAYQLFAFRHTGGRWQASVKPVYYGLQLFAQAAPAGSRLIALGRHGHAAGLSTWATRAPDGTTRVVLINKSSTRTRTVKVAMPGATRASVERMLAPSISARGAVTLGGNSYGTMTSTGVLPAPHTTPVAVTGGGFAVSVPHGSAALVTIPAS